MYCPQCGQQQVSDELRSVRAAVLARRRGAVARHRRELPALYKGDDKKLRSPRAQGVRQV